MIKRTTSVWYGGRRVIRCTICLLGVRKALRLQCEHWTHRKSVKNNDDDDVVFVVVVDDDEQLHSKRTTQSQSKSKTRPNERMSQQKVRKKASNMTTLDDVVDIAMTTVAAAVLTNHKNIIVTLNTIAVRFCARSSPHSHLHLHAQWAVFATVDVSSELTRSSNVLWSPRAQAGVCGRRWWTELSDQLWGQTAYTRVHIPSDGIHFLLFLSFFR